MPEPEHIVERRATMLAQKMERRVDILRQFLTPAGARPPFTQMLQEENALKFWMAHRYDDLGARALQHLQPHEIAELDTALALHYEGLNGVA